MAKAAETVLPAPIETDLLGDPVTEPAPVLPLEDRLAALEALTQKLLDYGAALQLEEVQARLTAIEADAQHTKDEVESLVAGADARFTALKVKQPAASKAFPTTLDELPSPYAEG